LLTGLLAKLLVGIEGSENFFEGHSWPEALALAFDRMAEGAYDVPLPAVYVAHHPDCFWRLKKHSVGD